MNNPNETIDKAISVHGIWKGRILLAIQGQAGDFRIEDVERDDRCEFGKWFFSLPVHQRDSTLGQKVKTLHGQFHAETARILKLALESRRAEALQAIAAGGEFARLSGQLLVVLTQWKSEF